jgi:hypothetical protein
MCARRASWRGLLVIFYTAFIDAVNKYIGSSDGFLALVARIRPHLGWPEIGSMAG